MSDYVNIPKLFWRCVDGMNANHIKLAEFSTDIDVFNFLRQTRNPDFDFELRLC